MGAAFGVGTVAFSEEITPTFEPSADTYVAEWSTGQNFGGDGLVTDGTILPEGQSEAFGVLRFDISAVGALSGTPQVIGGSLQLYVHERAGHKFLELRELMRTGWTEYGSTLSNFDGTSWSWGTAVGGKVSDNRLPTAGYGTFQLNAAGIALCNANKNGSVNFGHEDNDYVYDDYYEYMRYVSRHGIASQRPKLTLVVVT